MMRFATIMRYSCVMALPVIIVTFAAIAVTPPQPVKISAKTAAAAARKVYKNRDAVKVSTVSWRLPARHNLTLEKTLEQAKGYLDQAGRAGSDIVCLPELFATKYTANQGYAESVPDGSICRMMSDKAKQWKMYVLGCLYERRGGKKYNVVVLFDRAGRHAGTYDKVHLPPSEAKMCARGRGFPVFETDFGKIGCIVCVDLHYPESVRSLMLGGAEIVFNPTMYSNEDLTMTLLKARATENQVFMVMSNYWQKSGGHIGRACVVAPSTRILADTGCAEGVATATIDLAKKHLIFGNIPVRSSRHPDAYTRITAK